MNGKNPWPREDAVTSIGVGIILTFVTCGIYALYWQYKQMQVLNSWLCRKEFDFVTWLLLSILTCGIFAVYYEYKMARAINEVQHQQGKLVQGDLAMICILLTIVGIWIASLAIQQGSINEFYGADRDL